jgi:hypothetical protein
LIRYTAEYPCNVREEPRKCLNFTLQFWP